MSLPKKFSDLTSIDYPYIGDFFVGVRQLESGAFQDYKFIPKDYIEKLLVTIFQSLSEATELQGDEIVCILQDGEIRFVTVDNFGTGGGTGTLKRNKKTFLIGTDYSAGDTFQDDDIIGNIDFDFFINGIRTSETYIHNNLDKTTGTIDLELLGGLEVGQEILLIIYGTDSDLDTQIIAE